MMEGFVIMHESGNISVHTENIFPIIKRWLYSDKDIFIRELVSNGCDAVSKLKRIVSMGEAEVSEDNNYQIKVIVDKEKKTLTFVDNGIGMTSEEVKKYINQVAFSSAEEFVEKYKDKNDEGSQIIGHFGLGFYSAFMVSESVQIETLSYQDGAQAVKWTCSGGTDYEMDSSQKEERGTTITLFIDKDNEEFLDEFKVREVLVKYCSFLPVEIYLENVNVNVNEEEEEKEEVENAENEKAEGTDAETKADETGEETSEAAEESKPMPINDTHPLWLKKPSECTDEEYKDFYRKVFHDFNEPLFWIHLNVDYPFKLSGILYFPKLKHELESIEGQIKLFNNQVFVADNIKEVIPEFLMLLKGVLDCPELPLNVSRSFLQNDGYVTKVSSHITKKVGDKLTSIFDTQREEYNKYWDDINPFIKYGCLRNDKFYDRVKDIVIYKTTGGDYSTLNDYLDRNKEKHENKVYYVSDEKQQAQYINLFKEHELEAVIMPATIDNHFISFLEMKESQVKFNRIDSDISESLKEAVNDDSKETEKETSESLEKLFKEALGNDALKLQIESLKSSGTAAVILLSEHSRRMQEMSRMFAGMNMPGMFQDEQILVLNKNNNLIKTVFELKDKDDKKEDVKMICEQIYDLALMSHKPLEAEAMTKFVERSNKILARLAQEDK